MGLSHAGATIAMGRWKGESSRRRGIELHPDAWHRPRRKQNRAALNLTPPTSALLLPALTPALPCATRRCSAASPALACDATRSSARRRGPRGQERQQEQRRCGRRGRGRQARTRAAGGVGMQTPGALLVAMPTIALSTSTSFLVVAHVTRTTDSTPSTRARARTRTYLPSSTAFPTHCSLCYLFPILRCAPAIRARLLSASPP